MSFDRNQLPDPDSYYDSQGLKFREQKGIWRTTKCVFHSGNDSMRVNTATGGWRCMNCDMHGGDVLAYHMQAHGLEFIEAATQLGAWVNDGKPSPRQTPAPLPPRAALEVLAFESNLIAVAGANVANGVPLSDKDRMRVLTAANRISRVAEAYQ